MENQGEFKTIEAEEMTFGKNNFLEVARKKAVATESESEFLSISRGFFASDGTKRFRRSLALPDDKKLIEFISQKLSQFHKEQPEGAKEAPEPKEEPEKEAGEAPKE